MREVCGRNLSGVRRIMKNVLKKIFKIDSFRDFSNGRRISRLSMFSRFVLVTWEYDEITEEWL